jgi:uncharacterized protein (DUF58 family)
VTHRGRIALALGVLTYACAWAFGSKPLYPVAVGLLLAVFVAWAWVGLANRPMRLHRALQGGDHVEGDDVMVKLELERESAVPPGSLVIRERIAKVGERRTPLHGKHVRYRLTALPRGRYAFEQASAVLEDSLGLQRVEVPLQSSGAILVYPRLVELERLFSESGSHAQDGRRLLLRRPSGFDLHSVREYTESDSLRAVHWRSTAKRGELMVKELEDAPRDEVAVLLDADGRAVTGKPPDSSFDAQVRAAGSILLAHARRNRRSVLIVNSVAREVQRIQGIDGDWRRALEVLACVEPTGHAAVGSLLADEGAPAARALELAVVTASLDAGLVDRLLQRALARRSVSLVWIDAASFAPGASRNGREPMLLRLQAAGVPVAVVRRGDDLAAALSAPEREVAHA